ncbi:MAG: hypothetical protein JW841_09305 [Deltaproteobacteria bacterium]|nr:hypothetical protein [Deltaproteobacteria bacterium]
MRTIKLLIISILTIALIAAPDYADAAKKKRKKGAKRATVTKKKTEPPPETAPEPVEPAPTPAAAPVKTEASSTSDTGEPAWTASPAPEKEPASSSASSSDSSSFGSSNYSSNRDTFGLADQIVPLGSIYFSYNTAGEGTNTLNIAPGALYFIMDNIAVGGKIAFHRYGYDGGSLSSFAFEPLAGYNLELGDKLTFLPQLGIIFDHSFGDASATFINLDVFAPALYHITSHFFIGAGPGLIYNIIVPDGYDHSAIIQLTTIIGGYFSL